MGRWVRTGLLVLLAFACTTCRKAYDPKITVSNVNFLVVEGVLNSTGYTTITLSRTVKLNDSTGSKPVLNASVTVEGDDNSITYLNGDGYTGNYTLFGLLLDPAHKYRLRIKTTDNNKEYLSDYVPVKNTPPIDSIGFTTKSNGLQLYVNSHDATNSTRYYRWDYEEGWQFHSEYQSFYYSDGSEMVYRNPSQQIYFCYGDHQSDDIVLASSAKLSKDIIYQAPVLFIPSTSEKLEAIYGIQMREYALTEDAFKFWTNMRNISEELGSIFDPLPSNINGNIHCLTNPKEVVIGYVSAGSVQSKKVFITHNQVPQSWTATQPYSCQLDTFLYVNKYGVNEVAQSLIPLPPAALAAGAIYANGFIIGFTGAASDFIDCTVRGNQYPPSFWY
jgi:uncharacterized protein DUF4249